MVHQENPVAMAAVFPFVLMGFGAFALTRGLFRPHRAVIHTGGISKCSGVSAGTACDPADTLAVQPGTDVYALSPGRVVLAASTRIEIVLANEPVVLVYDGVDPLVPEGHHVGRGETIGRAAGAVVRFATLALFRGKGGPEVRPMPPSAWLAARGMRHAVDDTGAGGAWCEGGRHIGIPVASQRGCEFAMPDPAGFSLLPVEIGPVA